MLIGLTGGIASGKSTVATMLRQKGLPVVDADDIAQNVLKPGHPAYEEVLRNFGPEFAAEDGTLDRARLRQEIFSFPERRYQLNTIMHPAIARERKQRLQELLAQHPVVIYDAALLIETGTYQEMDIVILVACEPSEQINRIIERDGGTREAASAAVNAQLSTQQRRPFAHFVLENNGDLAALQEQVNELLGKIVH
ncbi:dephospho-CoA kinase [Desulfurispira natronophila]|uniref:Dephospho-CoA kinase n=1 Tax=Desulfurispira natronophila TaxID=682562 RepID=A0A7W7Y4P6_9BACT|nr:dephospho-CoA kinase [Desulfurispira natronophila]MBB5021747.1 dephospho-CoA kinase [Desulfurispira natronophila]